MNKKVFSKCFAGLVLGVAGAVCGQDHVILEVIPAGQVIGRYPSNPTETYVVIEDRLISERPLIDGVLQGQIIEPSVPLASERIEAAVGESVAPTDASVPAMPSKDPLGNGDTIAQMAERSAKLEAELASLKELFTKHVESANERQELVVAKLAEAIKERDDARVRFEASMKEYVTRNQQVTSLAVGLREAYERLEAKRAESGEVAEKSVAMINEIATQIKAVAGKTRTQNEKIEKLGGQVAKHAEQTEKLVDRVEAVTGHLQSLQSEAGENAESVEQLKQMISTLEDRVKELEKNRGRVRPKNDQ